MEGTWKNFLYDNLVTVIRKDSPNAIKSRIVTILILVMSSNIRYDSHQYLAVNCNFYPRCNYFQVTMDSTNNATKILLNRNWELNYHGLVMLHPCKKDQCVIFYTLSESHSHKTGNPGPLLYLVCGLATNSTKLSSTLSSKPQTSFVSFFFYK